MLRLRSIKKSYTTAGFTQNALDGVSIAFRDNEFAAILGPSGSGKTTMLNIIGGLDQYDSGDLEIDGISTNSYKASDWDTYRNNRIGFVFQSYNLIPHQNVLANVELALTLSGVSRGERRRRAKEALEEVGLGEHIRKKPGQLSGGQMQRVAIARALINDPEILLADEPTGALDTTTSKQVMELLTEIAKDRLVIMVTHNNELAEKHANRIVRLTDGIVTADSRPLDFSKEDWRTGREARKASMSFLTAIMLSFSNLMTKKGRTITTAFAGSIGIIGIASILALSNGINAYIRNIEEETLSIYPLAIQNQGFDLSGFFGNDEGGDGREGERRTERPPDTVREMRIMETVFSTASSNDLASLKVYLEENRDELDRYVSTVHYMYDVTPQIFLPDTSDGVDQVNPDSIFSGMMNANSGFGAQDGMSFMPSMNIFSEMPNEPALYESQYKVLAGNWPESYDEAVLVVGHGARITDFAIYSIGLRDRSEMKAMLESVMNRTDTNIEITESERDFPYDTLMDVSFKVIQPADLFHFDDVFDVWVDKSGDSAFMEELVNDGISLKIVGIVEPNDDASAAVLASGVNYTPELVHYLMEQAAKKRIVREQLASPDVNVLSGNTFEHEQENPESGFDFSKIISVDEDVFRDAFDFEDMFSGFDFGDMDFGDMDFSGLDMSGLDFGSMDFGSMDLSGLDLSGLDLSGLDFSNIDFGDLDFGDLDFGDLDFSNIDLSDIDLSDIDFSDIDLSDIDFSDIDLSDIDFSDIDFGDIDLGDLTFDISGVPFPELDLGALLGALAGQVTIPPEVLAGIMGVILTDFIEYVTDLSVLPPFTPEGWMNLLNEYLAREETTELIMDALGDALASTDLEEQIGAALQGVLEAAMMTYMEQLMGVIQLQIQAAMQNAIQSVMQNAIQNAIQSVVQNAIQSVMQNAIQSVIQTAMTSVMQTVSAQIEAAMQNAIQGISAQIGQAMQGVMQNISSQIESAMQVAMQALSIQIGQAMQGLSAQIGQAMRGPMTEISKTMESAMRGITDQIQDTIKDAFEEMSEDMQSSMDGFDAEALADAFQIELGEDEIFELMMSIMNPVDKTFEQNLTMLGYADPGIPTQILIYPRSFEAKQSVLDILERYNTRMEETDQPDKVVHFTDIVGIMMSTVTDIIDMVSYALVAFVSVALIVSSIMIGVITFISVLERKKEIGILRAVGASKGNIRLVFNAETLIIGLVAGVIGVFATFGIIIVANIVLYNQLGIEQLVLMPPVVPLILVLISMFLTYIAGLLPASAAASKPPVDALRSE